MRNQPSGGVKVVVLTVFCRCDTLNCRFFGSSVLNSKKCESLGVQVGSLGFRRRDLICLHAFLGNLGDTCHRLSHSPQLHAINLCVSVPKFDDRHRFNLELRLELILLRYVDWAKLDLTVHHFSGLLETWLHLFTRATGGEPNHDEPDVLRILDESLKILQGQLNDRWNLVFLHIL